MPQATSSLIEREASTLPAPVTAQIPQKFPHASNHLYLKGRIFYYRYKFPKKFCAAAGKEIRISLRTAYQGEASRRASKIHDFVLEKLENWHMAKDIATININPIEQIREAVAKKVDEILHCGEKRPIEGADLRKRLNSWLQRKLDEDRMKMEPFKCWVEGHQVLW